MEFTAGRLLYFMIYFFTHWIYIFFILSPWLLYFAIFFSRDFFDSHCDPVPETYRSICIFFFLIYLWPSNSFSTSRSRTSLLQLAPKRRLANLSAQTVTLGRFWRSPETESLYSRTRCRTTRCGFGRAAKVTLRKWDFDAVPICFPVPGTASSSVVVNASGCKPGRVCHDPTS